MNRTSALLAALCLAAVPAATRAQTLLGGAEASMKLPAGFSASVGVEYRTMQWFDHTEQWSAEAAIGYKPLKWLKFSAGYKFIQAGTLPELDGDGYATPQYWDNKHRLSLSVSGQWKPVGKLTLSLRERYQYTLRPSHLVPRFNQDIPWGNKTVSKKSGHILRSRLQAEFKPKKKCRWTPFANFELYTRLADVNHTKNRRTGARFCEKWRLAAGTELKLDRKNSLELFYRYANQSDPDENDSAHTIALVYSFSL